MYRKRKEWLRRAAIYILAGIVIVFLILYFSTDQAGAVKAKENDLHIKPETFNQEYRNKRGQVRLILAYQYPNISGKYEGIDKINCRYITMFSNWLRDQEELVAAVPNDLQTDARYGNEVSYMVTYNKNSIISVLFEGYLYTGGAHGMPYRNQLTLSLDTGNEVQLTNILNRSEEEIKQLVDEAFFKKIDSQKDLYWENAKGIVEKTTYAELKYYFTEEGIVFYYDPYILAPFAGGFIEALVKYE